MTDKKNSGNKLQIIALLVVFALPVVLAYTAYWLGWFKGVGVAAHGRLLTPVLTSADYLLGQNGGPEGQEKYWKIIVYSPTPRCDHVCEINVALAEHARIALGKDASRVRVVYIYGAATGDKVNADELETIAPDLKIWRLQRGPFKPKKIYIMDPMGNVMLEYDWTKHADEAPLHGKGMLKDLKKLLKYSHIG